MVKCTTACLVALALLGLLCDAHKPSYDQRQQNPKRRNPSQNPVSDQSKQTFEIFTWTYPPDDVEPTLPQVDVELRHPEPAVTVTAVCAEAHAEVTVIKDLFNNGQIINSNDMKLGGCNHVREDETSVYFEHQLHECDSTSEVSTVKKRP